MNKKIGEIVLDKRVLKVGVEVLVFALLLDYSGASLAQAWRDCIPNSIAPGGCNSIAPGGGASIAPGGGLSIAPRGGMSIGLEGGQSTAPLGGQSIAPGGGQALDRDRSRGLNVDTMRPYGSQELASPGLRR